jgi:hypothetical protein
LKDDLRSLLAKPKENAGSYLAALFTRFAKKIKVINIKCLILFGKGKSLPAGLAG